MKIVYNAHIGILLAAFFMIANPCTKNIDASVENASTAKSVTIKGKVEFTGRYCGGAAPPESLLENIRKKKPRAGYKLYVRPGKVNDQSASIIDSTDTDENGRFAFNLAPGEYVLLSVYHKNKDIFKTWKNDDYIGISDRDCLEDWWSNGLTSFTLGNQPVEDLYLHFQKQCFLPLGVPCLIYKGPYPP